MCGSSPKEIGRGCGGELMKTTQPPLMPNECKPCIAKEHTRTISLQARALTLQSVRSNTHALANVVQRNPISHQCKT